MDALPPSRAGLGLVSKLSALLVSFSYKVYFVVWHEFSRHSSSWIMNQLSQKGTEKNNQASFPAFLGGRGSRALLRNLPLATAILSSLLPASDNRHR